jgi:hypothetical protein
VIAQAIVGHLVPGSHKSGRAVSFQVEARVPEAQLAAHSGIKEAPFRQDKLQAPIWGKLSDKCGVDDAGGIAMRPAASSRLIQQAFAREPEFGAL